MTLPWLGDVFTATLDKLPPGGATVLLLGRSRSSWGTINLPFDLMSLGMPGCKLYVGWRRNGHG